MTEAQANLIAAAVTKLNAAHTLCEAMAVGNYNADEQADVFKCVGVVISTVAEGLETARRVR